MRRRSALAASSALAVAFALALLACGGGGGGGAPDGGPDDPAGGMRGRTLPPEQADGTDGGGPGGTPGLDARAPGVGGTGGAAGTGGAPGAGGAPGPGDAGGAAPQDGGGGAPAPDAGPPRADAAPIVDARPRADVAPAVPSGCEIVRCGAAGTASCCGGWFWFGLDSAANMMAQRRDLVKTFNPTSAAVAATFQFEAADQEAALGMTFAPAQAVRGVKVAFSFEPATQRPFLTLESPMGDAGCLYAILPSGDADLAKPSSCWGKAFTPDHLTVRMEARAAGPASLRITRVEIR